MLCPEGLALAKGSYKGHIMPNDAYWTNIGKDVEQRRRCNQYRAMLNQRRKDPRARVNRKRWPKGTYEVMCALKYLEIPHYREHVIPLPFSTFFQADFSLYEDKVFVEIDGPEHDQRRDERRMERINAIPQYADWAWLRLKESDCFDRAGLLCTFGKWARNLDFLL